MKAQQHIPDRLRTILKFSYPDEDHWVWYCANIWYCGDNGGELFDDNTPCYTEWALSLCSDQNLDWGYIAIVPIMNGEPLPYGTIPEPWHSNWAIDIVGSPENSGKFFVTGTIAEVKHWIDSLLGSESPDIPSTATPS
jgi:hypothetical protein